MALELAAKYLETIPAGIYPFSMLLTEKTVRPSMSGDVTSISSGIFFRTLLLSDVLKQNTDAKVKKYINKIMIDVILNKMDDNAVNNFSKVSASKHYDVKWEKLEPNLPDNFDPDILTDPDALEEDKKAVRDVLGKYGFVSNYEQLDLMMIGNLFILIVPLLIRILTYKVILTRSFPLLRKNLKGVGEIIL